MSLASPANDPGSPAAVFGRWQRRSRQIRVLRRVLPAAMTLMFLVMGGYLIEASVTGVKARPVEARGPIQMVNPRFVGRDRQGRAFVLIARSATRDETDDQKVILDRPLLTLERENSDPVLVSARQGLFSEATRILNLEGDVKLNGGDINFSTASSIFNSETGELGGLTDIQGAVELGQITAKAYGVYDKGRRIVFKGGVHTRLEQN